MSTLARQDLIDQIRLRLGEGIVDVELDPAHYQFAISATVDRYRQRSGNSFLESFLFIDVQPEVTDYTLPEDVQQIRSISRRGIGGTTGGAQVDPFALAYSSNLYMINNPGGLNSGGAGQLATYDFAMQFQSLAARIFGRELTYTFDPATHKLTLHRKFQAPEQIMLQVYAQRPEDVLISDVYARPWIRDYAVAYCKSMLGEAREKFNTIAGPQGGTTLNGTALKQEAKDEMERLEKEIVDYVEQNEGYGFVIG